MRRFELVEGTSSKFWEITLQDTSFTVRYGRIGTNGQTQTKDWPDAKKARSEHDKLVAEKVKKGYTEIGAVPAEGAEDAEGAAPAEGSPPAAAPAAPAAPPPPRRPKPTGTASAPEIATPASMDGWLDAGDYDVSLKDGKVIARNRAGKVLASVPKPLQGHEVVEMLDDASDWLDRHAAECLSTVEQWMLRSLTVPLPVLQAVWADPAWRAPLENAVVRPHAGEAGLLRGVDPVRGVGLVTLDGETIWSTAPTLAVPHPILLGAELDEWRAMLTQLDLRQGLSQLFRDTFVREPTRKGASVDDFSGGEFPMLNAAFGEARKHGFRIAGGCAVCRVLEGGQVVEARYWLGEGDPMYETVTGDLSWVDGRQRAIELTDVGPIAWSEGMRMASRIWAKRKIEEKSDEQ